MTSLRLYRLAALMTVCIGLGLMASARAAEEMERLAVVERATTDVVTDLGAEGDSVGDILTFANEIYDQANANRIGHDNGWCVRTVAGKAWECFWTLTFDKNQDQITVEGPFYDDRESVLAVTGGTGRFSGVRGEMTLHARDAEGSAYDFIYSLIR
jgi:hypothetical protein